MTVFTTTPEQKIEVYKIASIMSSEGLSPIFVTDVVKLASIYEGAYELMQLWIDSEDPQEKDEIIADLHEEAERLKEVRKRTYNAPRIDFDDLQSNADAVIKFKKELRQLVDKLGGISKLSKKSGIPQPSLSRFFSSASFPRDTTVYRIVDALLPSNAKFPWTAPISINQINAMIWNKNEEDNFDSH